MQIKPSFGVTAMDVLKFCAESNPSEFLDTLPEGQEAGIIVIHLLIAQLCIRHVGLCQHPLSLNTVYHFLHSMLLCFYLL